MLFFTARDRSAAERTVLDAGARSCRALDPRPPEGYRRHISTHLLSILEEYSGETPRLPEPFSSGIILRIPGRLMIHPGSGGLAKTWPLDRFSRHRRPMAGRNDVRSRSRRGGTRLQGTDSEKIPGNTDYTLGETFNVLTSAELYLGCDSGISHLAALTRTPSTVLFGPTDPDVWRPPGEGVTVIASPDGTMEGIAPDTVMASHLRS